MKKLAEYIRPKAAKERAKNALESESALDISNIEPNTIAVVSFTNKSEERELDPLQKGLAEMVATDLSQVKRLTIIERVQMQALVDEMALDMTGLLEEKNSERIGKLLRAERIINGSFAEADGTIKMDAGIADAIEEESKPVGGVEGNLEDLFKVEKDLVFKIVKEMDIVLTDEERKQIEVVPTENILAFLAYSRGLDAEDRGDFAAAQEFYTNALQTDPGFRQASVAKDRAASNEAVAKAPDLTSTASEKAGKAGGKGRINTSVFVAGRMADIASQSFMPEVKVSDNLRRFSGLSKEYTGPSVSADQTIEPRQVLNSYITSSGINSRTKTVDFEVPLPDVDPTTGDVY
jgi:TolB-like protein